MILIAAKLFCQTLAVSIVITIIYAVWVYDQLKKEAGTEAKAIKINIPGYTKSELNMITRQYMRAERRKARTAQRTQQERRRWTTAGIREAENEG